MVIAERPTALEQPLEHELDPGVQAELMHHPGKWVALTRSAIVAVGDDIPGVLEAASAAGVDSPILYQVPSGESTLFF